MAQNKVVNIVEQAMKKVKKNKTTIRAAQTTKRVITKTETALNNFNQTYVKKAKEKLKKVPGFKQVIEINDAYHPLTLPVRVLWFVAKKDRFVADKQWMDTFLKRYKETDTYEWSKNYCNRKQKNANLSAIIKRVGKLNYKPIKKLKKVPYDKDKVNAQVLDFYLKYFPSRYQEAKSILNGTHPLFIDENGVSHIYFDGTNVEEETAGHVARHYKVRKPYAELSIKPGDSFNDQLITAHELAHALSESGLKMVSDARRGIMPKSQSYDQDAKGEVESLIMEKLYLKYALDHGIITKKEYENLRSASNNDILWSAERIEREQMYGLALGPNPSQQDVKKLLEELKHKRNIKELDKIKAFENAKAPSWYNRYLCGQVVAEVWMDRYERATKQQQKVMLNNFTCYLSDNKDASIDGACTYLLGMDLSQTATVYMEIRETEPTLTKARDSIYTKTIRTKNAIKTL